MKNIFAFLLFTGAAFGASFNPPPVFDSLSSLTNSPRQLAAPFAFVAGTNNAPPLLYLYVSNATDAVNSPWVVPSVSGGRYLSFQPVWTQLTGTPTNLPGYITTAFIDWRTNDSTSVGSPITNYGRLWFKNVGTKNQLIVRNPDGTDDAIIQDTTGVVPQVRIASAWRSLVAGANVTITTNVSGDFVVAATASGGGSTNGSAVYVDGATMAAANLIDSAEINPTAASTNVTFAIVANSIETNKVSTGFRSFFLDRANHTGTQLVTTISDFVTNVWGKILTTFQQGNGVKFATNSGANTLTISGNYAPGPSVAFLTNADTSITIGATVDRGITFDGATGGTIVSSTLTNQTIGTNDFSIWARIKVPETLNSSTRQIMAFSPAQYESAEGRSLRMILLSSGELFVNLFGATTSDQIGIVSLNNFQSDYAGRVVDVAFTRSGTHVALYVNGIVPTTWSVGGTAVTWGDTVSSSYLLLGANGYSGYLWNSAIYRAVAFNRALNSSEISLLSANGVDGNDLWGSHVSAVTGSDSTFAADTGYWTKTNTTIAAGVSVLSSNGSLQRASLLLPRHRYRCSFVLSTNSGTFVVSDGVSNFSSITNNGTNFVEFLTTGTTLKLSNTGAGSLTLDDVTLVPIGAFVDLDLGVGTGMTFPDRSTNALDGNGFGAIMHVMPTRPRSGTLTVNSGSAVTNIGNSSTITNTITTGTVYSGLTDSGVVAGSYTNPTVTIDAKGRVTTIASGNSAPRFVEIPLATSQTNQMQSSNSIDTTYILTTYSGLVTYWVLPTNNIPLGALFTLVVAETNTPPASNDKYVINLGVATNRVFRGNTLRWTWNGYRWFRQQINDMIRDYDGILYGWLDGAPYAIPVSSDSPYNSIPYVRMNESWRKLTAGANVTISTNGSGDIAISASSGGGGSTNGSSAYVDGVYVSSFNMTDSTKIDISISGTNVTATILANSLTTNDIASAFRTFFLDRANHTGTQLASTISDFATNVWSKILTTLQQGNGVKFATNAGANTLTISGNYAPGANVTFTTNADTSITIAAASGGGSTNGTPVYVNGSQPAAANFTNNTVISFSLAGTNVTATIANSGVTSGTYTSVVATVGADGRVTAMRNSTSAELLSLLTIGKGLTNNAGTLQLRIAPGSNITFSTNGNDITIASTASGGGGLGTNLFVNNILSQPAKLTNSATVTWSTNANGDIVATAAGASGGLGTNLFVNNVLMQPAKLTNSSTVTWSTNASGDFYAVATGNSPVYTTNRQDVPIFMSYDSNTYSSTNETSIIGTLVSGGSTSIAANALANETVIRVRASGYFTAAGDWQGPTIKVKLGGRILTGSFQDSFSGTPSNNPWTLEAYFQVNAAGSNASNTVVGWLSYEYGDHGWTQGGDIVPLVASGTLDTTTTNAIAITFANDPTQPLTLTCKHTEAYYLNKQVISGGGGMTFVDGALVTNPNFVSSTYVSNVVTSGTNITPTLTVAPAFVLNVGFPTTTSLASNTTYYIPRGSSHAWSQVLTFTNGSIVVPFKSKLVSLEARIRNGTTAAPTGSNVVFYATKNGTTDTQVWTNAVFDLSQVTTHIKVDSTLSGLQFNEGDFIGVKYATPAWWSTVPQPAGGFDLVFERVP